VNDWHVFWWNDELRDRRERALKLAEADSHLGYFVIRMEDQDRRLVPLLKVGRTDHCDNQLGCAKAPPRLRQHHPRALQTATHLHQCSAIFLTFAPQEHIGFCLSLHFAGHAESELIETPHPSGKCSWDHGD
jgi:hypothetical protein